jgi:acetyl-CoA acetyltransferase
MAVASGFHDIVIVAGLEKMTDTVGKDTTAGLATAADAEYEALHGVSFVGLNALIMQRYMYEYDVPLDAFAGFSINAHRNGANNPNAMFQEPISLERLCARAGDRHADQHHGQQPGLRRRGGAGPGSHRDGRTNLRHRPPSRRGAHSGQRQRQRHAGRA